MLLGSRDKSSKYTAKKGSSEENHLPHFRESDVIDDVTVTSWVGDDVTCQFS